MDCKEVEAAVRQQDRDTADMVLSQGGRGLRVCRRTASFRARGADTRTHRELRTAPSRQRTYANLGSHFHSNSRCLLTQGQVFGLWFCVACRDPSDFLSPVCCCRDLGDCFSPVLVWSLPLLLSKDLRSGMVSDGFQTQRRGFVDPG